MSRNEQTALGHAMDDPRSLGVVVSGLKPEDYSIPGLGRLHHLLATRAALGEPCDLASVLYAAKASGEIDRIGGHGAIIDCTECVTATSNTAHYVARVQDEALRRRLTTLGKATIALAKGESAQVGRETIPAVADAGAIVSGMANRLMGLALGKRDGRIASSKAGDALTIAADEADARIARGEPPVRRVRTGIVALDKKLAGGLRPGNLVILGGRPGVGKSALMMNIVDAASEDGLRVGIISLEMTKVELDIRAISGIADVPGWRVGGALLEGLEIEQDEWDAIVLAREVWAARDVHINDTPALSWAEVVMQCNVWASDGEGVDLLVLDYLQLMTLGQADRHDIAVGAVTTGGKKLAKDASCPVVILSQLNRGPESRAKPESEDWREAKGRPRCGDLKDSGAIEQDADVILFPLRPPEGWAGDPWLSHVEVAKQRGGECGEVPTWWDGPTTKFSDLPVGGSLDML